jgi:transposase
VLDQDMRTNERALTDIVRSVLPELLDQPGVGPFSAAQLLVAFSHPGRCRNEAAFAALGGVAPLEASTGRVVRHRLHRHGDRKLNRALHTIATSRMRYHGETKTYRDRRIAEGKSDYEIRRCLKRGISRSLYRLMQRTLASEDRLAESRLPHRYLASAA